LGPRWVLVAELGIEEGAKATAEVVWEVLAGRLRTLVPGVAAEVRVVLPRTFLAVVEVTVAPPVVVSAGFREGERRGCQRGLAAAP
jgi:hypothetical protein